MVDFSRLFSKRKQGDIPEPTTQQNQSSLLSRLAPRRFRTYSYSMKQKQLRSLSRDGIIRRGIEKIKRGILTLDFELVPVDGATKTYFKRNKETVANVLSNPNIIHDYHDFFDMILEDLIVLDAGVFNKCLGGNPLRPIFLYPVDSTTIGKLEPFDYTNPDGYVYEQTEGLTMGRKFTTKDIAYLQMNHFTDTPYGLSSVEKVWRYLNYFMDALDNAADIASNDIPKYLINVVNGEENKVKDLRSYISDVIQGTGNVPVVGGDVRGVQVGAINSDSLFLEWQKFLLTLTAKCFDLPESFFIASEINDRNTISETEQQILINAIKPYANVLERAINKDIIQAMGVTNVKFQFKYQQTDEQRKLNEERVIKKYESGLCTENEGRAELGHEISTSKYSDLNIFESKAQMNKDYYVQSGGFNGQGTVKDNSDGGDKNG